MVLEAVQIRPGRAVIQGEEYVPPTTPHVCQCRTCAPSAYPPIPPQGSRYISGEVPWADQLDGRPWYLHSVRVNGAHCPPVSEALAGDEGWAVCLPAPPDWVGPTLTFEPHTHVCRGVDGSFDAQALCTEVRRGHVEIEPVLYL